MLWLAVAAPALFFFAGFFVAGRLCKRKPWPHDFLQGIRMRYAEEEGSLQGSAHSGSRANPGRVVYINTSAEKEGQKLVLWHELAHIAIADLGIDINKVEEEQMCDIAALAAFAVRGYELPRDFSYTASDRPDMETLSLNNVWLAMQIGTHLARNTKGG